MALSPIKKIAIGMAALCVAITIMTANSLQALVLAKASINISNFVAGAASDGTSGSGEGEEAEISAGEKGDAGVSPTVAISKQNGVTTITITDSEGTHTATINDGEVTNASLATTLANYYTKTEVDTVQTETVTANGTNGKVDLTFRRYGKVVCVEALITMDANNNQTSTISVITVPDFAKRSASGTLASGIDITGYSIDQTDYTVVPTSLGRFMFRKLDNGNYQVIAFGIYGTSQSNTQTWSIQSAYIVD